MTVCLFIYLFVFIWFSEWEMLKPSDHQEENASNKLLNVTIYILFCNKRINLLHFYLIEKHKNNLFEVVM